MATRCAGTGAEPANYCVKKKTAPTESVVALLEKTVLKLRKDMDDFLKELDIRVMLKKSNDFLIPRISQLTLKTNRRIGPKWP